jgi:hypothetical protein
MSWKEAAMYAGNEREELSRQSLVAQAVGINETGRRYYKDEADSERLVRDRDAYEKAHGEVARLTLLERVEYVTYAIGLLCVYGIDVFLFGASAQFVAGFVGSDDDSWTSLAKYATPACFLGIEVMISLQIAKSGLAERFAFGSAAARKGWIAVGVLAALVMPLAAMAAARAAGVVADDSAPILMIVVLAVVSFAAHVIVLFAGRLAQEAKTYLTYAVCYGIKRRSAQRAIDRALADIAAFNSRFISYVHAWRAHNAKYAALPSGPFDREVVELIWRQFPHVATGQREAAFPVVPEETP